MISIGITGQTGFVGTHLFNTLGQYPDKYKRIPFEDCFFKDDINLRAFIKQCDVIVHLAAIMRSPVEGEVYRVNMKLVNQLVDAMNAEDVSPCILFSSSIQEGNNSEYGRCKLEGRQLLEKWAKEHKTGFEGMIFPNLFGPYARPNSHSFIATFCYKLTHGEEPQIFVDNCLALKYVGNLMKELVVDIDDVALKKHIVNKKFVPDFTKKVTDVLNILKGFKEGYLPQDQIEEYLFETFETYKAYTI
jgi:UDP-2-acetamido-2,6-beta-L-arabino-hexul-4-ose reductase